MSIDLQGWYMSKRIQYSMARVTAKKRMSPLGCNHSETSLKMYMWDCDETYTFMQQVEAVIANLGSCYEAAEIAKFRKEAEDFNAYADNLGLPIRSDWL